MCPLSMRRTRPPALLAKARLVSTRPYSVRLDGDEAMPPAGCTICLNSSFCACWAWTGEAPQNPAATNAAAHGTGC